MLSHGVILAMRPLSVATPFAPIAPLPFAAQTSPSTSSRMRPSNAKMMADQAKAPSKVQA
jgi:hypothetical protein